MTERLMQVVWYREVWLCRGSSCSVHCWLVPGLPSTCVQVPLRPHNTRTSSGCIHRKEAVNLGMKYCSVGIEEIKMNWWNRFGRAQISNAALVELQLSCVSIQAPVYCVRTASDNDWNYGFPYDISGQLDICIRFAKPGDWIVMRDLPKKYAVWLGRGVPHVKCCPLQAK